MKKIEEVIKAYVICMSYINDDDDCKDCPYAENGEPKCYGADKKDALYYLKEYKKKLDTPDAAIFQDDENPALTWDDLCRLEMIGVPVWNSRTLRWMLLIDSANDGGWVELINHAGGHEKWIGHDLRKNPLYRKEKK